MSIWPRRRPALPAYARAWLDPEERVLAFASTPYGDLVVATQRGLWITDHRSATTRATSDENPATALASRREESSTAEPAGRLLAWELVVTARWADDDLTVIVAEEVAPRIMKRVPPITVALPEPADLPRVVRQRVDRSVAFSHRQGLGAGSTVLIVGRRVSGRDGLLWYAVFDRDSDADDPQARHRARTVLESAAGSTSRSVDP